MPSEAITVPVRIDGKAFRRFARFDTFRIRKRWISPLIFAVILLASAAICFSQAQRRGAVLLGGVLTLVALGVPAVYFGSFARSITAQIKQLNMKQPRAFYTVTLAGEILVDNDVKKEKTLHRAWKDIFGVWRTRDAVYLYIAPNKAFILPAGQASVPDSELWAFIQKKVPAEKLHEVH